MITKTKIVIKGTFPKGGSYEIYDRIVIEIEAKNAIELRAIIDKLEEKIIK